MKPKLVQFGAGNIGRSFIGQVFARSGYEVVFIDIARELIEALNKEHEYRVLVKRNDLPDDTILVRGVRALDGTDLEAVAAEIADARLIATSVGKAALPHVLPAVARGLELRFNAGARPIDIILAENVRDAAAFVRTELERLIPEAHTRKLAAEIGIVETSIGKMVPIMTDEDRNRDPLWVFAEPYNSLIVDGTAFRSGVPDVVDLKPVANISAYVDRKLFVHNLGHAAAAYIGHRRHPERRYLYEVLEDPGVLNETRMAMSQAATALAAEYPEDLSGEELEEHISDLLGRFQNRSLKDTVFRVGRDLPRKLAREDRLIGAMLLAARHKLPFDAIAGAAAAALRFRGTDEHGEMYPPDRELVERVSSEGLDAVLSSVCDLGTEDAEDKAVRAAVSQAVGR